MADKSFLIKVVNDEKVRRPALLHSHFHDSPRRPSFFVVPVGSTHAFVLQGKGLFSNRTFKEGDAILEERPVVCCQFPWNSEFGYSACDHCLRPLETAEENVRRLTGNPNFVVPHKECCDVNKSLITACPLCGVKYCSVECQNEAFQR